MVISKTLSICRIFLCYLFYYFIFLYLNLCILVKTCQCIRPVLLEADGLCGYLLNCQTLQSNECGMTHQELNRSFLQRLHQ